MIGRSGQPCTASGATLIAASNRLNRPSPAQNSRQRKAGAAVIHDRGERRLTSQAKNRVATRKPTDMPPSITVLVMPPIRQSWQSTRLSLGSANRSPVGENADSGVRAAMRRRLMIPAKP